MIYTYFAIDKNVKFVCFQEQLIRTLRTPAKKAVKNLKNTYIEIRKTDWKDKNLCMHKGLQFEK
jgi:hypothetical protein